MTTAYFTIIGMALLVALCSPVLAFIPRRRCRNCGMAIRKRWVMLNADSPLWRYEWIRPKFCPACGLDQRPKGTNWTGLR
jgi:hypothetical protein